MHYHLLSQFSPFSTLPFPIINVFVNKINVKTFLVVASGISFLLSPCLQHNAKTMYYYRLNSILAVSGKFYAFFGIMHIMHVCMYVSLL